MNGVKSPTWPRYQRRTFSPKAHSQAIPAEGKAWLAPVRRWCFAKRPGQHLVAWRGRILPAGSALAHSNMAHPDVPAEQAYLDRAYGRLEAVRAQVECQLKEAYTERGGTFQSYTERDIKVRNSLGRLEQLELGSEALIFGRIDTEDGESFHIGRLALSDERHEPLVVDWRAPIAEPFYRATGAHPMGLRLRRHLLTEGRRVLDLEDELFVADAQRGGDGGLEVLGLSGPGVLMAALSRAHRGRMHDIVATVQAEQDEVIRAPLPGILVVQGGPGTGKTAVALHRAAYLLYTYRWPLESQGVLVVGPTSTFLRYIDQVLPSLGETGAELATARGLYKGVRPAPASSEPAEVARMKGDPRMSTLIRRAVRQRERPLRRPVELGYGSTTLVLSPEATERVVKLARRRPGTHNSRRRLVERLLWRELAAQLACKPAGARPASLLLPAAREQSEVAKEVAAELRGRAEVAQLLDRMWPRLSPEELLYDLFGTKALLEHAGRGLLSASELSMLYRPRDAPTGQVSWSPADIALLDEAFFLLGPVSGRPLDDDPRARTYGHVVVDEAQDLSPMELRMIARRSLSGSMTLAGDIAQATGPWAPASWQDVVAHLDLSGPDAPGGKTAGPPAAKWRESELTVSYRAPAEVMELAAGVLAEAVPGASAPEPVRRTGAHPRFIEAASWYPVLGTVVGEELAAVAGGEGEEDGSVGVLTAPALVDEARSALLAGGISFGEVGAGALETRVSLLAITDAKGLEFDAVVVVEPASIVAMSPQGLRALYVALTRCTRRLAVVYSKPLPACLERGRRRADL
jgi:DNA helicase IV